ncbi:hypothetical protein C8J56DRAFT_967652 [Mycena floridula]|nr:hypothetical protein C8J56DRAFT_967652 [Mycena floridula]
MILQDESKSDQHGGFGASVCLSVPDLQSSPAESPTARFLSTFRGQSVPFYRKTPFLAERSSATNRKIFSEFDKPDFLQFVQSGGLIHDTLFRFGTVFVVKRHALLDCLSLLVSSTTGLTIAKRFQSKLSQPKLSLVHHDSQSAHTQSQLQQARTNSESSSAGPMHR